MSIVVIILCSITFTYGSSSASRDQHERETKHTQRRPARSRSTWRIIIPLFKRINWSCEGHVLTLRACACFSSVVVPVQMTFIRFQNKKHYEPSKFLAEVLSTGNCKDWQWTFYDWRRSNRLLRDINSEVTVTSVRTQRHQNSILKGFIFRKKNSQTPYRAIAEFGLPDSWSWLKACSHVTSVYVL